MKQFKHLITSGCSFSETLNGYTWPLHLGNSFNIDCNHVGLGSQGNGLISRKAIYAVQSALNSGFKPEEILVCIMWSGYDRHDIYFKDASRQLENNDHWMENPTTFVDNDPGGWVILNHHWTEKTSKIYYAHMHDFVHQRVLSYEKILLTQYYLDNLGIPYVMTDFMRERFHETRSLNNPNCTWLETMINRKKWLPIESMFEWCRLYWGEEAFPLLDVTLETGEVVKVRDFHPQPEMHARFVKEMVLPYIKEQYTEYLQPEFKEYHRD